MNYQRKYVQFNDLVFDGVDMISANDLTISFKRYRTSYTEKNGSWSPNRGLIAKEAKFAMTILLKVKKLPCEVRPFYRDFVVGQLSETGRLWAVQNNTLVWAWAELDAFGENVNARDDTIEIDVDVTLPEGIFHKADLQKTFLQPWDICDFMDCYDFKKLQPCVNENGDCCTCATPLELVCKCETCECLTREMALCYHTEELQKFYSCDGAGWKIHYSCEAAERHFNSLTHYQGQKLCTECGGTIAGQLYSNTDIPTDGITIRLSGQVKNPYIEINGNGNQIMGEYTDLTIYPDGTAVYGCDNCEINVEDWVIPEGNDYGWTVHQGNNRVVIETGNCCGLVCAYFMVDARTI